MLPLIRRYKINEKLFEIVGFFVILYYSEAAFNDLLKHFLQLTINSVLFNFNFVRVSGEQRVTEFFFFFLLYLPTMMRIKNSKAIKTQVIIAN